MSWSSRAIMHNPHIRYTAPWHNHLGDGEHAADRHALQRVGELRGDQVAVRGDEAGRADLGRGQGGFPMSQYSSLS